MRHRTQRSVATILAVLALLAPRVVRGQGTEIRLPGLPWGSSVAEVTAALVEREFEFVDRDSNGSLMFEGADLLGHEASLIARMYRGRLVKVVAFLEPREGSMGDQRETLVRTISRFFGNPSGPSPPETSGTGSDGPDGSDTVECDTEALVCWLAIGEGGVHGLFLRTTDRPGFRLDFESPLWKDAVRQMGRPAAERDAIVTARAHAPGVRAPRPVQGSAPTSRAIT